jgi:ATP-dependent exoDNAse (exonuclease V) beta subunit
MRVWCVFEDFPTRAADRTEDGLDRLSKSDLPSLYQPIVEESVEKDLESAGLIENSAWSATHQDEPVQGNLLGTMVHKAIQYWLFPVDSHLIPLLEAVAINAGIASEEQRAKVVRRAFELLERLRSHPIWEKINMAMERHHELPFLYQAAGRVENRFIDLLYREESGWQIVDFKTDPIFSDLQKEELVQKYTGQCQRYRRAVRKLLGVEATVSICFLDDRGGVALVDV